MLMPNSLAILGRTFEGERRGRMVGIWAAAGAMAGAIGPVLGGWLVDVGNWRWIFLLNVPVGLAAWWCAVRFVPRDERGRGEPLDWLGGTLATLALGALTWGLTVGSGAGGWTPAAVSAVVASSLLFALFLYVQKRRGTRAMMPLGLFASRAFAGLTLLTLLVYGALGALFVLVPYLLIEAGGFSATRAGAALLPLPVILAVASPAIGRLAGRIGPRLPLVLGPLVVAVGFAMMLRVDSSVDYWRQVFPALLVIAIGLSGAVAPLTTAVLRSVDARHTGSASGFNSAIARSGGLIATALLGSVLVSQGPALVQRYEAAMLVAAVACALGAACALLLERTSPRAA